MIYWKWFRNALYLRFLLLLVRILWFLVIILSNFMKIMQENKKYCNIWMEIMGILDRMNSFSPLLNFVNHYLGIEKTKGANSKKKCSYHKLIWNKNLVFWRKRNKLLIILWINYYRKNRKFLLVEINAHNRIEHLYLLFVIVINLVRHQDKLAIGNIIRLMKTTMI